MTEKNQKPEKENDQKQEKQVPLVDRWASDPNPCGFSDEEPKEK